MKSAWWPRALPAKLQQPDATWRAESYAVISESSSLERALPRAESADHSSQSCEGLTRSLSVIMVGFMIIVCDYRSDLCKVTGD
jgi:hypothetical protein